MLRLGVLLVGLSLRFRCPPLSSVSKGLVFSFAIISSNIAICILDSP